MQYLVAGDPESPANWAHIPLPPQQMLISTEQSSQGVEKDPSVQLSSNQTIVDHTHSHICAGGDESQVFPSGALNFLAINLWISFHLSTLHSAPFLSQLHPWPGLEAALL